jgi:Holliday junction DNA helicase RuvA
MIGFLRGALLRKQAPSLLLDVNGVGYELEAPMSTFYELPAQGEPVTLYTHLLVREDAHNLFGFATVEERELFRALIRISGVGAKMALAILSSFKVDDFVRYVQEQDVVALTRVPGIGKKTAARLLIEMRDRLPGSALVIDGLAVTDTDALQVHLPERQTAVRDALSALIALGYKPPEASRLVRAVDSADLSSEEIIRQALRATL